MKLRILKIVFAVALAVVSGVTAYQAQDKEMMSDLALANVEALAMIEDPMEEGGYSSDVLISMAIQQGSVLRQVIGVR